MEVVAGVIAALGTAVAAVIGAVALLRKASVPTSRAMVALSNLWAWIEASGHVETVPPRLARTVEKLIEDKDPDAP